MRLFGGERYPLPIYCHGAENLYRLLENLCHIALERGDTPIAYCSAYGEPLHFDQCFRPFSATLQSCNSYKVKYTDTSSAGKTAKKITYVFRSIGF